MQWSRLGSENPVLATDPFSKVQRTGWDEKEGEVVTGAHGEQVQWHTLGSPVWQVVTVFEVHGNS